MTGLAFVFAFVGGMVLGVIVTGLCQMAKSREDDPTEEFVEAPQRWAEKKRREAAATAQVLSIPRRQHVQD